MTGGAARPARPPRPAAGPARASGPGPGRPAAQNTLAPSYPSAIARLLGPPGALPGEGRYRSGGAGKGTAIGPCL
jgi:hypothetical protein